MHIMNRLKQSNQLYPRLPHSPKAGTLVLAAQRSATQRPLWHKQATALARNGALSRGGMTNTMVRKKPGTMRRRAPTASWEGTAMLVRQHLPLKLPQRKRTTLRVRCREHRGPTQPGSRWSVLFPCPGLSAHTRSALSTSQCEPHPDAYNRPTAGRAASSESSLEQQAGG